MLTISPWSRKLPRLKTVVVRGCSSSIMTNVGRGPSTVHYDVGTGPELARGDELGIFHLGSTAIVATTPEVAATLRVGPGEVDRHVGAVHGQGHLDPI